MVLCVAYYICRFFVMRAVTFFLLYDYGLRLVILGYCNQFRSSIEVIGLVLKLSWLVVFSFVVRGRLLVVRLSNFLEIYR